MDFVTSMEISASGLSAQRTRLNIISQNLANAETTRTAEGGPYRRRVTVMSAQPFVSHLEQAIDSPPQQQDPRKGVLVNEIAQDNSPFKKVHDPSHPDADADGYVLYPNVDVVTEMVNLISATRSYEANVSAVGASKNMALKALEIAR
ncbi:flagellar basal-body rod protein FlgC [Desulfarculus baarsii DSM 2075]|uniref:Flagellar basal-body rod protein FlgC n=1 Tax=Desulfarculus baarsii (strain ATCC 33931 / DSM 2075 / LMG 7858 / VKM B-1802 / 2st14) TaxID=644282 RepID=E1QFE4_DESB2|nr:flagellar basal body rod protein FlgC [Desulfarculus baarsii]ADK84280.1 flagellar basal-body rod protein FlgC [Desulfarculus baarsii DSM 2075]